MDFELLVSRFGDIRMVTGCFAIVDEDRTLIVTSKPQQVLGKFKLSTLVQTLDDEQ